MTGCLFADVEPKLGGPNTSIEGVNRPGFAETQADSPSVPYRPPLTIVAAESSYLPPPKPGHAISHECVMAKTIGCSQTADLAYALRPVVSELCLLSGLYRSSFFHIARAVAAIFWASVRRARFGLVPASIRRS